MIRNLSRCWRAFAAAGFGDRFHLYVLSDTSNSDIAAREEARFDLLANRWRGRVAITYRRRNINTGYKAGNIRDFCERWGAQHEFAVTLDADSFMTADAVLRLIRIMQADQSWESCRAWSSVFPQPVPLRASFNSACGSGCVPTPWAARGGRAIAGPIGVTTRRSGSSRSSRIVRCLLCSKDGSDDRHILSHDQIEAALMRAAGYDVRVLPEEDLGWEENPPTLIEFIRRDLRWCQGNMQYWQFLVMPGLKWVSRYQLALAILMFIGSPAWIGMLVVATLSLAFADSAGPIHPCRCRHRAFHLRPVMWFSPKLASAVDILSRPALRRDFGGTQASWSTTRSRPSTLFFCARSCGSATRSSWPGCCSAARSDGSARPATITRCRSRSRSTISGRTHCLDLPRSARWR